MVHQEDDGLAQFFGVTEVVLRSHFRAELSVEQEQGGVGYVEGCHGCADKVVRTRAVDDIELFAIALYVEYG